MIRVAAYPVGEVLAHAVDPALPNKLRKRGMRSKDPEFILATEHEFDGHMVKMTSRRYELFQNKGVQCVKCGIVGVFMALEAHEPSKKQDPPGTPGRFHFNLYGINVQGSEVLITKDHIIPKSKGGANHADNYQVMCSPCNAQKGNKDE